jgi:hypothetical protein
MRTEARKNVIERYKKYDINKKDEQDIIREINDQYKDNNWWFFVCVYIF